MQTLLHILIKNKSPLIFYREKARVPEENPHSKPKINNDTAKFLKVKAIKYKNTKNTKNKKQSMFESLKI